jgi:formylmethanofuran dehydrogenase subunit E
MTTDIEWHEKKLCDRCGFTYNKEDLVEQDGYMVCTVHCYDEPSYGEVDE